MNLVTSVVLADDHHVVRQGLSMLLAAEPDLAVVGEAADGLQAAEMVERLHPSVVVMDLMMPVLGGLDVTRRLTRRVPASRVLILSMHSTSAYVVESLRAGAWGYVLKDSRATELLRGIREVAGGRRYVSPAVATQAIEGYLHGPKHGQADLYDTLTAREREVLHLTAEGLSSGAVAARLGISARTAESHRDNASRKLGLRGRTELIRYALTHGILPLEAASADSRSDPGDD
jgi:DNA-binding NarL/FixJ family response regulator